MDELAEYIIRFCQNDHRPVRNLKSQALMFICMTQMLRDEEHFDQDLVANLYDKPFTVTNYGAVVMDIYERNRRWGTYEITLSDPDPKNYDKFFKPLDQTIKYFNRYET